MLRRIWRWIWSHKFVFFTIILAYLACHFSMQLRREKAELRNQQEETGKVKAQADFAYKLLKDIYSKETQKCPQAEASAPSPKAESPVQPQKRVTPVAGTRAEEADVLAEAALAAQAAKERVLRQEGR